MGREIKRVALDFDHPVGETWGGYVNPHWAECEACNGRGSTMARLRLQDLVSLLMLSGSDVASGECHPYLRDVPLHHTRGVVCGPDMAELTGALAGRAPCGFMGHDAVDQWVATDKILVAAGLDPKVWGTCPACEGEGNSPDSREAYDAWESTEPPAGDGYQLWETVSEGSPITPVFETAEGLARHLATHDVWGSNVTSHEKWLAFINGPGWAPSFVVSSAGFQTGVEAIGGEG